MPNFDTTLLPGISFHSGKFTIAGNVAQHIKEVFPNADLESEADRCAQWILSRKNYHGDPCATLIKFITQTDASAAVGNNAPVSSASLKQAVNFGNMIAVWGFHEVSGGQGKKICNIDTLREALLTDDPSTDGVLSGLTLKQLGELVQFTGDPAMRIDEAFVSAICPHLLPKFTAVFPSGLGLEMVSTADATECVESSLVVTGDYVAELVSMAHKKANKKQMRDKPAAIRHFEKTNNIARYDNWCGHSGMFKQTKNGKAKKGEPTKQERKSELLSGNREIEIKTRKIVKDIGDYRLTIITPVMGEWEQTLLLTLMSIARKQDAEKKLLPCNKVPMLLPLADIKDNLAAAKMSAPVSIGVTQILGAMKKSLNVPNFKMVPEALMSLASVIIKVENKITKRWEISHLISSAQGDGYNSIEVSLNHRLTEILLASGQAGCAAYATINMEEHLSLSTGPTRLLHTWLCVWGTNKNLSSLHLDTMILQIYGEIATNHVDCSRQKKSTREAVQEIANLPSFAKHKMPLGIVATKSKDKILPEVPIQG